MSTRSSNACSRRPETRRRLALATALLTLTAAVVHAADTPKQAETATQAAPETATKEPPSPEDDKLAPDNVDPVTEVVQGDALTQIRIAAISFNDQKNLGQALSGVIGAFLKRDRLKDAMVDLSVIHDPVWRAYALMHFAAYHYSRGELKTVHALLDRAEKLASELAARPEETTVLEMVSQREAEYGNFDAARRIAGRIVSPFPRIAKFLEIAELQAGDPDRKVAAGAAKSLRLAFDHAKKATVGEEERLSLLLDIANAALTLRQRRLAQEIYEFGYRIVAKNPFDGTMPIVAEFAAGMVRAGDRARAMEIVRSMKNDMRHGYTLASVARAFADAGGIEGAVPLFYLALQDTENLEDGPVKVGLLTHIIKAQTHAGRLADAFTTAGKIKDPTRQRAALFAMGKILLAANKPLEALKLVDYLPDMGMRAQIFTRAARHYYNAGDRKLAAKLMMRAVTPTGTKSTPETLAAGLPLIFEAQVEMGKSPSRDAVFDGARKLLELIPNQPIKVPVMTRIARAEMKDGQKDAAERSLGMAWRIAWFNKDKPGFPEMLTNIAMAQLNIGELLLAFDTAARISDNTTAEINELETMHKRREFPKAKALTAIAVAAARQSEGQLALRAARAIIAPEARANAYRRIALAFPVGQQQATLGKGAVPLDRDHVPGTMISPAVEGSPVQILQPGAVTPGQ
jgi:tetratricopeptide (TPR) repeat protein